MMIRSKIVLTMTAIVAVLAAGCSEKPQTASAGKKPDAKAWETAQSSYLAEGWKGGDQAAWEAQMRIRAQAQNEYSRSAAAVPAAPLAKTP